MPYPYQTDVPEGDQGTAIRAIRGKELHDKVVSEKNDAGAVEGAKSDARKGPFKFGAKTTSIPFSQMPYQGDNFENKKDKRRVIVVNTRGKSVSRGLKSTLDPSKQKQMFMSLFSQTTLYMTTLDMTKEIVSYQNARMLSTVQGFAKPSQPGFHGDPIILLKMVII